MQAGLVEDQYEKITQLEGKPFESQSTSQHLGHDVAAAPVGLHKPAKRS